MSKTVDVHEVDHTQVVGKFSKLMVRALRALGQVGAEERQQACQFAGQAWALLHEEHPNAAERMNGVLHWLTGPRFANAEAEVDAAAESEAGDGTEPGEADSPASGGPVTDGPEAPHPWLPAPDSLQSEAEVAAYYEEVGAKAKAGRDFDMEVRHLLPADRHTLIIDAFNKLSPGQGFILVNDHDPKPLYYQFAFEYADQFTWDPIEEGPEVWRVRIGKR